MLKRQTVFAGSLVLALATCPVYAQISRLPEAVQKKLAEINPLYQSDIRKYGDQTIELFTPLLAAAPKVGVNVDMDLAYGADPKQKLDVYHPDGAKDLPIVVFVHGGALTAGDKNVNKEISANVLYYFARHQYLGINANYRLAPKFVFPAAAQDIGSVVAWVKKTLFQGGKLRVATDESGLSQGAAPVAQAHDQGRVRHALLQRGGDLRQIRVDGFGCLIAVARVLAQ